MCSINKRDFSVKESRTLCFCDRENDNFSLWFCDRENDNFRSRFLDKSYFVKMTISDEVMIEQILFCEGPFLFGETM